MVLRKCSPDAAGAGRLGAAHSVPGSSGMLAAGLRRAGVQPLRQTPIAILNTSYNPASFSYWVAQIIRRFIVSRQSVTEEEAAEWFDEFAKLEESGAYFFCITPVLTEAVNVV